MILRRRWCALREVECSSGIRPATSRASPAYGRGGATHGVGAVQPPRVRRLRRHRFVIEGVVSPFPAVDYPRHCAAIPRVRSELGRPDMPRRASGFALSRLVPHTRSSRHNSRPQHAPRCVGDARKTPGLPFAPPPCDARTGSTTYLANFGRGTLGDVSSNTAAPPFLVHLCDRNVVLPPQKLRGYGECPSSPGTPPASVEFQLDRYRHLPIDGSRLIQRWAQQAVKVLPLERSRGRPGREATHSRRSSTHGSASTGGPRAVSPTSETPSWSRC